MQVMSQDELMVVSFLAVYAGGFLGLLWLTDQVVQWMWDHGLFWYIAAPVATVIWMANLTT